MIFIAVGSGVGAVVRVSDRERILFDSARLDRSKQRHLTDKESNSSLVIAQSERA